MIQEFISATLLLAVLLVVPGFLLLKSFRISSIRAVCFSPVIALFLYSLMGIILHKLHIATAGVVLSVPVIALSVLVFCISSVIRVCKRKRHQEPFGTSRSGLADQTINSTLEEGSRRSWLILLGYCAVGAIIYSVVYLSAVPSLNSVPEDYDNIFHFNLIRSFVDSGSWSLLNSSIYLDTVGEYPAPFSAEGKYYPAAWHILCALPISILEADIGIAANALNLVLVAFVVAPAMFVFLSSLFKNDRVKLALGAVVVFAFGAFPWVLLTFWPLYPNLVGMMLVPLVCTAFLITTERGASSLKRVGYAALTSICVSAQAFSQPNSVFADVVILAPYVVYATTKAFSARIRRRMLESDAPSVDNEASRKSVKLSGSKRSLIFGCAITGSILVIWFVLTEAPFMQRVVDFYTVPLMSSSQALASSLSLSLAINSPQYALGLLVLAGAAHILIRDRGLIWLLVSYLISLVFFVVAASFGDVWIKHFLTGFWYTDPYRVASIVPIAGIPVAILGLYGIGALLVDLIEKIVSSATWLKGATYGILSLLFAAAIYIPGVLGSADSNIFKFLRFASTDAAVAENRVAYSEAEKSFVDQAKQIVGDDSVVLNNPFDGSMVAYGLSGLPVYNRSRTSYDTPSESHESAVFREHLNELAVNQEVQDAIDTVGAEYVLSLDKSANRMRILFYNYDRDVWSGFTQLSDETPGLELVLSDGGMKLYKIVV